MEKGLLIVISAPSGSGKTTLCKRAASTFSSIKHSISATTRSPRKGEKNGRDYYFLSREAFEEKKQRGEFLEWAEVFGEHYGTLHRSVEDARSAGKDVILSIDVQGASQIKKKCPEAIFVFILPPSIKVLEKRLRRRRRDRREEISKRLRLVKTEISKINNYDYVIVNKNIRESLHKLLSIVTAEKSRINRMKDGIND